MYDGSFPAAVSFCGLCLFGSCSWTAGSPEFHRHILYVFGGAFLKASLTIMTCDAEIDNKPLEPKSTEIQAVESSVDSNAVADPPPDGGYGWICVASVFIINGFTWGVTAVRVSIHASRHVQPLQL